MTRRMPPAPRPTRATCAVLACRSVRQAEEAGPAADVQRAAQDCVDLGLVCAYQPDAQSALARYALEPMFEDEIRAAAVSDIRRAYVGLRDQLALYDFTVFHGLPAPLLINEAPLIDWRVRAKPAQPFVSLPLGPYCLLVGTPSGKTSRDGPVLWKSVVSWVRSRNTTATSLSAHACGWWRPPKINSSQYKTGLLQLKRPNPRIRSPDRLLHHTTVTRGVSERRVSPASGTAPCPVDAIR